MDSGLAGQRPAPRNDVPAAVCGRKCQSIAVAPLGQEPTDILDIYSSSYHKANIINLLTIMIAEKLATAVTAN